MRKFVAPFLALFIVAGCSGITPETGTERYVAADAAFSALLVTVQEGVANGAIPQDQFSNIKVALQTAKIALDAWGLVPESKTSEDKAIIAVAAVRGIIKTVAPTLLGDD